MFENDNKQYLMYSFDLALNGVVHCTGARRALVARHVNTHQMHVGWKELQICKYVSFFHFAIENNHLHTTHYCKGQTGLSR